MRVVVFKRVLLLLALVGPLLVACGGEEWQVEDLEPATLRLGVPYQSWTSETEPLLAAAVERFQEQYPRIDVEIVALLGSSYGSPGSNVGSGRADVFLAWPDPGLAEGDEPQVLALDTFLHGEGLEDEDFLPGLLDIFRWEGNLYAIPVDVDVSMMYYNRGLFDAQGVPYPRAGWIWGEFLDTARQMTSVQGRGEDQTGHWGFVSHPVVTGDLFNFVLQHGGRLVDDPFAPTRLVLDDPLVPEAIQWYADLARVREVMPVVEQYQVDMFSRFPTDAFALERAAMVIGGLYGPYGDLRWNFDWGVVPLPRDQVQATLAFVRGFYIASATEHPEAAWALVRSLAWSDQAISRAAPARRSVVESEAYRRQVGAETADAVLSTLREDAAMFVYNVRLWDWVSAFAEESYWVIYGSCTAEEMMAGLGEEFADWAVEIP